MESYQLLQTIYEISKHDPKPENDPCKTKGIDLTPYAGVGWDPAIRVATNAYQK